MAINNNLAPDIFTFEDLGIPIAFAVDMARGLGRELATLPPENGWDQESFFAHEAADYIVTTAVESAKAFAKANQLFYNKEKLENAVAQRLIAAYGEGFLAK